MKVYIKTYGCQMNERDSEAAAAMMVAQGYVITDCEEDADILLFNTCSVRDHAERKAIGKIGILKRLKKKRPDIFIGVMGCMAQSKGEELLEKLPHVDFVIGTEQLHKLPEIVESELTARHKKVLTDTNSDDALASLKGHFASSANRVSAYIAIMRGCNRFCSYCIVPHVRGREKSRTIPDVIEEAKALADTGIKEIMLLGQNVAAFGLDGKTTPPDNRHSPFADLLTELNVVEGIERIRFASPYPSYFNEKLIDAIASLPKVCNNVHLPLQSGSDRILKLMNRQYTAEEYLRIVETLKAKVSGITFSTDIIVAFPGESEEDFNSTRTIMRKVGFDNAFIFKYSPRKGTPASEMPDEIPQEVKEYRNQLLLKDLGECTTAYNRGLVGKTLEILVEGPSRRNPSRWAGRTQTNKVVIFEPAKELQVGELIDVTIERTTSMTLYANTTSAKTKNNILTEKQYE